MANQTNSYVVSAVGRSRNIGHEEIYGLGKFETQYHPNSDHFSLVLNRFVAELLGNEVDTISVDLFY